MAFIGLRRPVYKKITESGNSTSYTSGGGSLAEAMSANLTITRSNNPLRGDDVEVDNDNGVTAMSLEIGTTDMDNAAMSELLGYTTDGTTQDQQLIQTDAPSQPVGFGYIRVRRKRGAVTFQAFWYYRVTFSDTAENATTRGEQIEWQTPTITGRVQGLLQSDGSVRFRAIKSFTTQAAAEAWMTGMEYPA